MSRRRWTLLALPLLLGGCGQQHTTAEIPHPSGPRVVLRLSEGQGMGTAQTFFSQPPVLVVTGDGTTYLRGEEVTAQGIVWPMFRFQAGEQGVQVLLHEAEREGLLTTPPDYSPSAPILDGGDTTVALAGLGGTWTHVANGLSGVGQEGGPRGRLAAYVAFVGTWGREPRKPAAREIQPTALRVLAQEVSPDGGGSGEAVGRWPTRTAVDLARIGDCTVVRDPAVVHRLTSRDARYYRQHGHLYAVAAAVLLPGESCGSGPAS